MKRYVLYSVLCSIVLSHAMVHAGLHPDNGPGCGLGKLAWSDYGGQKQIAPQVMMATTNTTFGSQTFGISFGTSGCTNDGLVMKNKHINLAEGSFESLAQDMAQGRGEHLSSLASLLGISEQDRPRFFSLVQENYTTLMSAQQTDTRLMLEVLQAAMAQDTVLAKAPVADDSSVAANTPTR